MNRKEQNIAIFEDTMDWIEREPALSGAVQNSIAHTVLYPAQQMPDLPEISRSSKTTSVWNISRVFFPTSRFWSISSAPCWIRRCNYLAGLKKCRGISVIHSQICMSA